MTEMGQYGSFRAEPRCPTYHSPLRPWRSFELTRVARTRGTRGAFSVSVRPRLPSHTAAGAPIDRFIRDCHREVEPDPGEMVAALRPGDGSSGPVRTARTLPRARACVPRVPNTRYQAGATPYLGRTFTGWIAPASPGARVTEYNGVARRSAIHPGRCLRPPPRRYRTRCLPNRKRRRWPLPSIAMGHRDWPVEVCFGFCHRMHLSIS